VGEWRRREEGWFAKMVAKESIPFSGIEVLTGKESKSGWHEEAQLEKGKPNRLMI